MKILRIGDKGAEQPAVLIDSETVALLPATDDLGGLLDQARRVEAAPEQTLALAEQRLGAPVQPGKIVCVGLNYADHAAEGGQPVPDEPILFMKAPDTIVGPLDDVVIPHDSAATDWEVEIGVVIAAPTAYLTDPSLARDSIAGYVLCNDVSERDFQLHRGGQWDKGKNCATFFPMGPWLVTADEIGQPGALKLGLDVNGIPRQDSSAANMIFDFDYLVWYVSQFMTLYPGDVISTGTPAGVGAGLKPPVYLQPGDVMRAWADELGEQRSTLVSHRDESV